MFSDRNEGFALRQSLPDAVSAVCPRCGTMNRLTVIDTPFSQKVTCSHCGADLGTVGELSYSNEELDQPTQPEGRPRLEGRNYLRRPRPEVMTAQHIHLALKVVHRKMPRWHARSVWISARIAGKNPDLLRLRSDADELLDEARQEELEVRRLQTTIPGAASSSRIADTLTSLHSIQQAMHGVLCSLPN